MSYRFFYTLVFTAFILTGCGSSSKPSIATNTGVKIPSVPFQIQGRVNKNSLIAQRTEAEVTVHSYVDGVVDINNSLSGATVDENGDFSLTVDGLYLGKPAVLNALIHVYGTQECQLVDGCDGGTALGESFEALAQSFNLRLVTPSLLANGSYNITFLTHLAEALISADEGFSGLSDTESALAISDANSRVASRFGIVGRLHSQLITDISNLAEWQKSNSETIHYSALGRSILEAMQEEDSSLTVAQIVNLFSSRYTELGLSGNSGGLSYATYSDILQYLIITIINMQSQYQDGVFLDSLITELSTEYGLAISEAPNQFDNGVASIFSELSLVDQAKAFVKDIQQIYSSIDLRSIVGLSDLSKLLDGDTSAAKALEGFGVQVDISELTSGNQMDNLLESMKLVSLAVLDSLAEYYSPDEFSDDSSIVVAHTVDENNTHHFLIQQQINVCKESEDPCFVDVDLSLLLSMPSPPFFTLSNGEVSSVRMDQLSATLNGSLVHDGLTVNLVSAQPQIALSDLYLGLVNSTTDKRSIESILIDFSDAIVALPVELNKYSELGFIEARAAIDAKVNIFSVDYNDIYEDVVVDGLRVQTDSSEVVVRKLEGLELNVAGAINNSSDDNFVASVNLKQPGLGFAGPATYTSSKIKTCGVMGGRYQCEEVEPESTFEGEFVGFNDKELDRYIRLNASLGYKANLKGVSAPVTVHLTGSRETPDWNKINGLKLTYPGHALNLNGEFNNSGGITYMRAVNLDGLTLALDSDDKKQRYGVIKGPSDESLGDIVDMGQWVKVNYIDGIFVSL